MRGTIVRKYLNKISSIERMSLCSGAIRIFSPMGKLRLCRKKQWAKWARFLLMGLKKYRYLQKTKRRNEVLLIRHVSNSDHKLKSGVN
jgi:hypothetical protein